MAKSPSFKYDPVVTLTEVVYVFHKIQNHKTTGSVLREKGKRGAVFCFAQMDIGVRIQGVQIGSCPKDKLPVYAHFALEKATRLMHHPHHVLSRQSANEKMEQYPGAIRTPTGEVFSLSGLPSHLDELCMLAVAYRLKRLTPGQFAKAIKHHPNKYLALDDVPAFLDYLDEEDDVLEV